MKLFLIRLITFAFILCCVGEVIIRLFQLVPDIPERYIDENGIQKYKQGQSGYYARGAEKWVVNEDGWLGFNGKEPGNTITVIGDSYIENIMNPMECNQGSILKQKMPKYAYFEAGRSGVSFIEAMELSKNLQTDLNPEFQLLYLSENDFYESISELNRYPDRVQISIKDKKILPSVLKSPGMKKVLYSVKLVYYMYLKFPVFVSKQNKGETVKSTTRVKNFDNPFFKKLFIYCDNNYELEKLVFIFHPNTNQSIIDLANEFKIKNIVLDSQGDASWGLGSHDGHWSCYGHNRVGEQVTKGFSLLTK